MPFLAVLLLHGCLAMAVQGLEHDARLNDWSAVPRPLRNYLDWWSGSEDLPNAEALSDQFASSQNEFESRYHPEQPRFASEHKPKFAYNPVENNAASQQWQFPNAEDVNVEPYQPHDYQSFPAQQQQTYMEAFHAESQYHQPQYSGASIADVFPQVEQQLPQFIGGSQLSNSAFPAEQQQHAVFVDGWQPLNNFESPHNVQQQQEYYFPLPEEGLFASEQQQQALIDGGYQPVQTGQPQAPLYLGSSLPQVSYWATPSEQQQQPILVDSYQPSNNLQPFQDGQQQQEYYPHLSNSQLPTAHQQLPQPQLPQYLQRTGINNKPQEHLQQQQLPQYLQRAGINNQLPLQTFGGALTLGETQSEPVGRVETENLCAMSEQSLRARGMQRSGEYFIAQTKCSAAFYQCAAGATHPLNCFGDDQVFDVEVGTCNFRRETKSCSEFDSEANCESRNPCTALGQFACCSSPQKCVGFDRRCDGAADCADGADERDCPSCGRGQFGCVKTGRCLPISRRCDGRMDDCGDGSNADELNCDICLSGQFHCRKSISSDRNRVCIAESAVCNGRKDCLGGEDEEDCQSSGAQYLLCENQAQSVFTHQWCNGQNDCLDASDEKYCFL